MSKAVHKIQGQSPTCASLIKIVAVVVERTDVKGVSQQRPTDVMAGSHYLAAGIQTRC